MSSLDSLTPKTYP